MPIGLKRRANYTFLWWCSNDQTKQVTILSTVPKCERKSWISDSVQQLVVMQTRCADVKREDAVHLNHSRCFQITDLICYSYIESMFAGISLIINLKAAGMSKTMIYTQPPTIFWTGLIITLLQRFVKSNSIIFLYYYYFFPGLEFAVSKCHGFFRFFMYEP